MVLQLTAVQRQANIVEDIHNVFHYRTTVDVTSNDDVEEFIQEWIDTVQPAILAFQTDQIVYLDIRAEVVGDVWFSSIAQGSVDGLISGTTMPPYVAYEFIYKRATRLTRNGFKRFAGVDEGSVEQAGNVSGTVAAALTAAEPVLGSTLVLSWGSAVPIIYGRPTPAPSSLPERENNIIEVAFQRVTTQNSRKPWR